MPSLQASRDLLNGSAIAGLNAPLIHRRATPQQTINWHVCLARTSPDAGAQAASGEICLEKVDFGSNAPR